MEKQSMNHTQVNCNEEWLPISGYEDYYEVSSNGRVKRVSSITRHGRKRKEGIIKANAFRTGYEYVELCKDNVRKKMLVHRLVAVAFLDNPDMRPQVNHINGNKRDNRRINLEWSTSSENQKHSIKTGLRTAKGEKNSRCKLTEGKIIEIRRLLKDGTMKQSAIAKIFNVSMPTITDIKQGRSWSHIPFDL
jgi:predicted XRE-type DNA-binding protein